MKVVKNDNNNPLSPAEMKACQQFEASSQAGQVLFQPQVATGQPAPNCVALFDGVVPHHHVNSKVLSVATANGKLSEIAEIELTHLNPKSSSQSLRGDARHSLL